MEDSKIISAFKNILDVSMEMPYLMVDQAFHSRTKYDGGIAQARLQLLLVQYLTLSKPSAHVR